MPKRQRIYLDEMVLTFASGAKFQRARKEESALILVRLELARSLVELVKSYVHVAQLRLYADWTRRARMKAFLSAATVTIKRSRRLDLLAAKMRRVGASRGDALHASSARLAGAALLTLDKELLALAKRHPLLFGVVLKPSQWIRGRYGSEEE
ncbi:hypothetical protein PLCT1_01003 [Planctomycetaceae bacterium]|nr:hypothetical protein PLCT1_01003 [Planctomycetaceae bacterium]